MIKKMWAVKKKDLRDIVYAALDFNNDVREKLSNEEVNCIADKIDEYLEEKTDKEPKDPFENSRGFLEIYNKSFPETRKLNKDVDAILCDLEKDIKNFDEGAK